MGIIFANPAGFWALCGLPAVLLLHFLQSKNRIAHTSTLFLLERLQEETRRGAVITRLRNGWQLWCQLLAVLLFALLLSQPRTLREDSLQAVAVVIDSSASMRAFPDELQRAVGDLTDQMGRVAKDTRWWILPSDNSLPRIAAEASAEKVLASLSGVPFSSGTHDVSPRLREARALIGPEGVVVMVSDHVPETLPPDVEWVSVGSPLPNLSLSGFRIVKGQGGDLRWQVSVLNRSAEPAERRLRVMQEENEVSSTQVTVAPGGMQTVEGMLPAELGMGRLALEPPDRFPLDDVLPFVQPKPKRLRGSVQLKSEEMQTWASRILDTVPGAERSADADVVIRQGPEDAPSSGTRGELWIRSGEERESYGRILPAKHPLTHQLEWNSLLVQPFTAPIEQPTDTVLIRMGQTPLALLRPRPQGNALILNFDPESGNGLRHGGLALLIHRYLVSVQKEIQAEEWDNALTGQRRTLPAADYVFRSLSGQTIQLGSQVTQLPTEPGWLTGSKEGETLVKLAVAHGELEEGDFRAAATKGLSENLVLRQRRQHEEKNLLLPLWMTLLGAALVGSWIAGAERGERS